MEAGKKNMRHTLATPRMISVILILQFIPFVLFPPSSFSPTTQEWWLPVLLAFFVAVAVFQLLFRRSVANWPWDLMGFAQGFNIISRLMLLFPHAAYNQEGNWVFNTPYVSLTLLSIVISALLLWYLELPEVRIGLLRE